MVLALQDITSDWEKDESIASESNISVCYLLYFVCAPFPLTSRTTLELRGHYFDADSDVNQNYNKRICFFHPTLLNAIRVYYSHSPFPEFLLRLELERHWMRRWGLQLYLEDVMLRHGFKAYNHCEGDSWHLYLRR